MEERPGDGWECLPCRADLLDICKKLWEVAKKQGQLLDTNSPGCICFPCLLEDGSDNDINPRAAMWAAHS